MKDKYKIANLVIGKMFIVYPYGDGALECETSKELFLVEKVVTKFRKILVIFGFKEYAQYREIFTDCKIELKKNTSKDGTDCKDFNTPYLTDVSDITQHLTTKEIKEGYISKFRVLEIYNNLNFRG